MKLVVCFSISDGYTWGQDFVLPIECESPEKLLCDFEEEVKRAADAHAAGNYKDSTVRFFGQEWTLSYLWDSVHNVPLDIEILTIDQWFDRYKVNQ